MQQIVYLMGQGIMTSLRYLSNYVCVIEAPKIMPLKERIILKEYATFKVICSTVEGSAPLYYTWLRNNEPISSTLNTEVNTFENTQSTLILKNIDSTHSGNYTCNVRNSFGHDKVTVNLHVKG